jgi:hypothetical protein
LHGHASHGKSRTDQQSGEDPGQSDVQDDVDLHLRWQLDGTEANAVEHESED